MARPRGSFHGRPFALLNEFLQLDHEFADVFERAVDGSKAHVSNLIRVMKLAHRRFANDGTKNLLFAPLLKIAFDAVGNRFYRVDADGTLFAGPFETVDDFDAIVTFPAAILFHHQGHHLFDPLIGREAAIATRAFPSPSDHVAVLTEPGVDDSIIRLVAKGAFHTKIVDRGSRMEDGRS